MKKSDITKQKILDAAETAFAEKGFYGARVDEITESAGVNKRMIYAYYGSKEKLYIAVLNTVYKRLAEQEKELLDKETDCISAVRSIIHHAFLFLYENPTFVKMVMWENLNEAAYLKQSEAIQAKGISIDLLRRVLHRGIDEGVFRKELDVEELIVSINMFCYSYFSNIYTMALIMGAKLNGKQEVIKRCEHVTDIILQYICA